MYNADLDSSTRFLHLLNFESAEVDRVKKCLESVQIEITSDNKKPQPASIYLIKGVEAELDPLKSSLTDIETKDPLAIKLIYGDSLATDSVQEIINRHQPHSFIGDFKQLPDVVRKAMEAIADQEEDGRTFAKVQKQNVTLESFTQNLEDLVVERTHKEYIASRQTESALKDIQSLLSFIKQIALCQSTEDLLNQVRREFKKFHGLMPPILVLQSHDGNSRYFYFQGKQFTEKYSESDELNPEVTSDDVAAMRSGLSNLFGRPFGPLSYRNLDLQFEEVPVRSGRLIFEHTLNQHEVEAFDDFASDRWQVINLALENILLRDNLQGIARQWSRTFNEMQDPILIINRQYKMTLSNGSFHADTDQTCYQSFAGRDEVCPDCPLTKTYETSEPQYSNILVEGRVYRVHSYPIHLEKDGPLSHVIHQYVDVSPSIDLQSKVIQGEKMAAVGLLAGNIAHELNNPLTGIHSLSDLLLQDLEEGTNIFKDLTEVKDGALRCQRIIRDLLDFSSVGADSRTKVVEVNDLISKTLPLLKMAMRSLNSDVQLDDDKLHVLCNPQLLQQVVFNLVNNACQAMDDGGTLTVKTFKEKGAVVILVIDTGSGIPKDVQQQIFDPFFTTKDKGKGTGLGLSMSRSVIEKHDGRLELARSDENGTEFRIELPLRSE